MKKTVALILILFFLGGLMAFGLSLFVGYKAYYDVTYGDGDLEIMDIYIPKKAYKRQTNGCVLFIHGGSWSGGDKAQKEYMCRYLASRGYITATMNYTLYSDESAETYNVNLVLDEIDMALERIKSFAAERGITVDKAATSGYSAGAHLSMLYSFSRGKDTPLPIVFTANLAGPADFSFDIWGRDLTLRIGEMLSGRDITDEMIESGEAQEIFDSLSPVTYINSEIPPSIFAYGGKDTTVSAKNGESVRAKLDAACAKYDYIFFPNSNHAMIQNPGKSILYINTIIDYCEKYFV